MATRIGNLILTAPNGPAMAEAMKKMDPKRRAAISRDATQGAKETRELLRPPVPMITAGNRRR